MAFTKTQVDEQLAGVFAEIYCHDNAVSQSIPAGAGYTKIINFTANGDSQYDVADYTNNKITITRAGHYTIVFSISFTGATANVNWFPAVFIDDVEQNNIHFQRKISTAGDYGSSQVEGFGDIVVGDVPVDVDARVRHDSAGAVNLTMVYGNIKATRVGIGA